MSDHLSIKSIVTLLYEVNPEYIDPFIIMVSGYDMVVSDKLNGWNGIDCKIVVKILHVTCEWKSDRVRLLNRASAVSLHSRIKPTLSSVDKVFIEYYDAIWQYYSKCFKDDTRVPYIITIERGQRSSQNVLHS